MLTKLLIKLQAFWKGLNGAEPKKDDANSETEVPKKRCISLKGRQGIIDELRSL